MRDNAFPSILIFFIALPALAALGHDIYLFCINNGIDNISADLDKMIEEKGPLSMFAALGFIWTQYHPGSYKWAAENLSPGNWEMLNTLLKQKAIFIGLIFAGLGYALLFGAKLMPSKNSSDNFDRRKRLGKRSDRKMKYTRK